MTKKTKHKYEIYVRSGEDELIRVSYSKNGSREYNVNLSGWIGYSIIKEDELVQKIVDSAKGLLKKLELNELNLKVEFRGDKK